mmetsp:Transcript_27458/g.63475  ORF Transcript_27458/g.63475 Transcript_27458/m.63475 type:complete len:183 (+) Transcript_27458:73-621(+)
MVLSPRSSAGSRRRRPPPLALPHAARSGGGAPDQQQGDGHMSCSEDGCFSAAANHGASTSYSVGAPLSRPWSSCGAEKLQEFKRSDWNESSGSGPEAPEGRRPGWRCNELQQPPSAPPCSERRQDDFKPLGRRTWLKAVLAANRALLRDCNPHEMAYCMREEPAKAAHLAAPSSTQPAVNGS